MAEKPCYDESDIDPIEPENKHAVDTPEYEELQKFSKDVVFLLQTVNDTEYNAALSVLKPPSDSFPGPVIFPMPNMVAGKLEGWKVALVKAHAGRKVASYVEKALKKYPNTRFVIGVGVCFAFVQQAEIGFADVLVSKAIRDFNYMKFEDKKIKDFGQKIDVVEELQEIFCMQAMRKLKFDVSQSRKSVMRSGTFCCNTFLIKDAEIRDAFHELNTGDLGGEMEGGELMQLQQDRKVEGIILIKGVADFADKDKNKHWQYTAAKAALHYIQVQLLNTDQSDGSNKKIPPIFPTRSAASTLPISPTLPVSMTSPHSAIPTQRVMNGAALPSSSPQVDTDSGMDDTGSQNEPTVTEFIKFPTVNGKHTNLAERIGTASFNFGIFLLEDDRGDCTSAIIKRHRDNAEDINKDIFTSWLKGKGRKPVSWATLVRVLEDMDLCTLADGIKKMKCSGM